MTKPAVAGRTVAAPPVGSEPPPKVVPVRHWGRAVGAGIVLVLLAGAIKGVVTNDNLEWGVVGDYLFDANVLRGLRLTLAMTALGMVAGLVLAIVVGVMRTSASRIVSGAAAAWVFVFRGIPLVVLLIFVGNLGLFFDDLTVGIPLTGVELWSAPVSEVVTPFWASVTALALAGSGYMAEVVRAGLLSVGRGQHEAAMALGLPQVGTLRFIVLPQALRVIIPPLGNELIGMLKASAIVSVIAGGDLMTAVLGISGVTFRTIEMLIVGTIWYLAVIAVLSVGQYFLERKAAEK